MSEENNELTQEEATRAVAAARVLHENSEDIAVYQDAHVTKAEGSTNGYWVAAAIWIATDTVEELLQRKYPQTDWRNEVANGDTLLGYAAWVTREISAGK